MNLFKRRRQVAKWKPPPYREGVLWERVKGMPDRNEVIYMGGPSGGLTGPYVVAAVSEHSIVVDDMRVKVFGSARIITAMDMEHVYLYRRVER